jgi:hypothetical protein
MNLEEFIKALREDVEAFAEVYAEGSKVDLYDFPETYEDPMQWYGEFYQFLGLG